MSVKKKSILMIVVIMIMVMIPTIVVEAKGKPKLTTKSKTLAVGETSTITLKNAGKTKWKTSNKKVVAITKTKKNKVTIKAKKVGNATVIAKYKNKKYKITIKVKAKKKQDPVKDNPVLNATDVELYYMSNDAKKYVKDDKSHLRQFQFKVNGTDKEVKIWTIEGEDADFFHMTTSGLLTADMGPTYDEWSKSATVKAKLVDGRILTTTVTVYSEMNIYLEKKLDEEIAKNIPSTLSDVEKAEKAAWYAGAYSDYETGQSSWQILLLEGRGDCCASRFLVEKMCKRMGIEACGCYGFDYHGETIIRIDGKYYESLTGFKGTRPREYMFYEVTDEYVADLMKKGIVFERVLKSRS